MDTFKLDQRRKLELEYRKVERGIRVLMQIKRGKRVMISRSLVSTYIERLRSILSELDSKPTSPRWPL